MLTRLLGRRSHSLSQHTQFLKNNLIAENDFRHSLGDCGSSQLYLSVCLSVCVSVCPAFTAYISVTMGWILIKFGVNVGT